MSPITENAFAIFERHQDYPQIIVVVSYLTLFSIAGSIGNAFVIFVFSKQREKSTTTIFILSLAGTDFFTCLVIVPFTIYYEIMSKRIESDIACKVYQFLITSNVPFSAFIMVVIAFDRYFKICRPWNHVLDVRSAKRILIGLIFFVVALGVITAVAHSVDTSNGANAYIFYNDSSINYPSCLRNITVQLSLNNTNHNEVTAISIDCKLAAGEIFYSNDTNSTTSPRANDINYTGMCKPNDMYISNQFLQFYQKFYASLFLISFILVAILYGLIFRSIVTRRSQKMQRFLMSGKATRRASDGAHNVTHTCTVTTRLTASENGEVETVRNTMGFSEKRRSKYKLIRDKQMIANIRTAGILFIVTAVFIIAFLPAWLMATGLIPADMIIFYMYYIYNVANPVIYAFFNQAFRKEMNRVLNCRCHVG